MGGIKAAIMTAIAVAGIAGAGVGDIAGAVAAATRDHGRGRSRGRTPSSVDLANISVFGTPPRRRLRAFRAFRAG